MYGGQKLYTGTSSTIQTQIDINIRNNCLPFNKKRTKKEKMIYYIADVYNVIVVVALSSILFHIF